MTVFIVTNCFLTVFILASVLNHKVNIMWGIQTLCGNGGNNGHCAQMHSYDIM